MKTYEKWRKFLLFLGGEAILIGLALFFALCPWFRDDPKFFPDEGTVYSLAGVQAEEVQTVLYARMDVRTLFELTDTEKEELLQLIDKPLKKIPYGFSNISGSGYLIFVNSSGERAWLSVRSVPYYEEKAYWKDTELGPVAFVDGEPRYYWVSSVLGSPYSNEEIQGEQVEELIHACEIRAQLAHAKETVSPEMLEELEEQKKRQQADLQ